MLLTEVTATEKMSDYWKAEQRSTKQGGEKGFQEKVPGTDYRAKINIYSRSVIFQGPWKGTTFTWIKEDSGAVGRSTHTLPILACKNSYTLLQIHEKL